MAGDRESTKERVGSQAKNGTRKRRRSRKILKITRPGRGCLFPLAHGTSVSDTGSDENGQR